MRVVVAGASGVIGSRLVPLLVSSGHDVVGLTGSRNRVAAVEKAGATVAAVDLLDRAALLRTVRDAAPDAVVHLATAIPAEINPKRMATDFALTNRLRTEGTRNLVDAADQARASELITQGLAYAYQPGDGGPANEDVPFWPRPAKQFAPALAALHVLERLTSEAGGLVLRFGHLYGPGSSYATDGSVVRQVRAGRMPIVGDGGGVFSFTHAEDAASAVVAALDRQVTGALNVVDDEPAPVREWLPELARIIGAAPPRHVPAALARLAVGNYGVTFMTTLRGADNARARLALDWRPRHTTWRSGFATELGGTPMAV